MDRRQRKTREAIFNAFIELLSNQHYNQITVGDIIDKADIGRATFYAHFETKDYLLKEMCEELFCHLFDTFLPLLLCLNSHLTLRLIQIPVDAGLGHQLVVSSALHDIAVAHHEYQVGVTDCRKTVGYDKAGFVLHQVAHGRLNVLLGAGIHIGGGLVQD